jgi:hypothetical protein
MIQLHGFFVILSSEHRTKNSKDQSIAVGDALEAKCRIAFLPFHPVMISSRAVGPLDVYHIHRPNTTGRAKIIVIMSKAIKLVTLPTMLAMTRTLPPDKP